MTDYSNIFGCLYVPITVQGHSFDLNDVQMFWGSLLIGEIEIIENTKNYVVLSCSVTGGTPPYSFQWFRSTDPYFIMDSETLIDGTNFPQASFANLPICYYRMRVTDSEFRIVNSNTIKIIAATVTPQECKATNTYFCNIETTSCAANKIVKGAYVAALTVCANKDRINFDLLA